MTNQQLTGALGCVEVQGLLDDLNRFREARQVSGR